MASSIVSSAAQQLGNVLVDEAKYLYKVSDKIESLQMEMEWMKCFLREADTKQHKEKIICIWVSQVRDLAYEAEDIIERYLHDVSRHRQDGIRNTLKWFSCILCTCDAWTLHNLSSDIDDLTIKISELTSKLQRYGIQIINPTRSALEYNYMSREERRTYSHIEEDVVGLKDDIKQVMEELVKENANVVGISGIGGLGKTTLARKVFLSKEIQNQYVCVWVYISQEFEKTRIFQEILSGLAGRKEDVSPGELPRKIDELLKNKKCFVVLDDIWTVDAWKRLEPAFQSIKNSPSKILLTTRKQDLLQHVDSSGYPHRLKPLSPEDSWELLKRKAFIKHESHGGESSLPETNKPQGGESLPPQNDPKDDEKVELEKLGRQMLEHCDGLPLAIVALGGILSTRKTIAEWKEVQQNISSYLMSGGQGQESARIAEVLELSYHDLPFYLKPCFLYLGSFPEDYEISAQRLYHLWEAEGLLAGEGKAEKQGETSYDVGERYLNELVQRSMVQVGQCWSNGKIKTCKVHDIMRDMCLKKGEEINFLNIVESAKWDDMASVFASCCSIENKKLRRCVVHWKGDDVEETHGTDGKHDDKKKKGTCCIRSILVFPPSDSEVAIVSKEIWKPFPLLRVLDLEGAAIEGVLEGVEDLIHLRYLSLRETCIDELPPQFYDLKCVETLDLRGTIMKLPARKLQRMERLRHLYLPLEFEVQDGEKLRLPVGGRMETLKKFDPSKCEIKDLLKMTSLRIFTIKRPYEFIERHVLKVVLEARVMKKSGQLINTVYLEIAADILKEEPTILSSLAGPPSSFALGVNAIRPLGLKDVVSRSIGCVDSLEFLHLIGHGIEIGEEDVLALGKLPHLKTLFLTYVTMPGTKLTFSVGSFPHLNYLRLQGLSEVEDWEVMDGALPNLQLLEVWGCKKLKKLPQNLPPSVRIDCN